MSRPSRTETEALEPNYLRELERDREGWWKSSNYDTWKNLYISEYARGHYILDTLAHFVPGFRPEGRLMLDVGCGDGGVPIAFAERGAVAAGIEPGERNVERALVRARDHGVQVRFEVGVAEDLGHDDVGVDVDDHAAPLSVASSPASAKNRLCRYSARWSVPAGPLGRSCR